MPCDIYEQREREYEQIRKDWNYYTPDDRRVLRGMSERRLKATSKRLKSKMDDLSRGMIYHLSGCEACKSERHR